MLSERDILNFARLWISKHGDDAVDEANKMIKALKAVGDIEGHDVWVRIAAVIKDRQNTVPGGPPH